MSVQVFSHPSKKVLVTGVSGTGKTTLFEKLIRKEKARWKFVFDHQGEFSARFGQRAATNIDELCEQTTRAGWIVFDPVKFANEPNPVTGERRGLPESFAFFCDYVFAMSETLRGRKIIACDELQKLVTNTKTPDELLCILDTGRRYQLDFFAISQAPNQIHNAIRNQITEIYTFRQNDKNAVQYLADAGFNENEIRNLEKFAYLWRNLATGEDNFKPGGSGETDASANRNPVADNSKRNDLGTGGGNAENQSANDPASSGKPADKAGN